MDWEMEKKREKVKMGLCEISVKERAGTLKVR